MPELPEVETIKNSLSKSIIGAKIINTKVYCRTFRKNIPIDFEQSIENASIIQIKRIAKYIILSLNNENSIIWHLGMSGKIKTCETEPNKLAKHDHVVITTDKCVLIYNDIRRFGLIDYTQSNKLNEYSLFKNIGIDPFDENLNAKYLAEKLKNKKVAIKIALLDQSLISGIGNIYASEALYLSRILPYREANSLSFKDCESLINAIREVLTKAIKAGGSTLKDYIKPDGSTGYFQNEHCVYNKTGQRCPNCVCDINITKGIHKITQGGRSTFYCKILQK